MATCNDCIHNEICQQIEGPFNIIDADMNCADFKLRSRFVELPADDKFRTVRTVDDLGRIVIPKRIRRELDINYGDPILLIPIDESKILLSKFTGSKEAEQALKECENSV